MLKFDDINICKKLLIREQKIINNCPSDKLISLKSSEVRSEVTNIILARDNVLCQKSIYLQKNEISIFKHNVKVFRNSPLILVVVGLNNLAAT